MSTVYLLLNFISATVYLFLAVYILNQNKTSNLNRVASFLLLSFALWSATIILTADTNVPIGRARFAYNVGVIGWGSFSSFFLWFTLIFTERNRILRTKWFYAVAFALPGVFIYMQWNNMLVVDFVKETYGWSYVWSNSKLSYTFYLYFFSFCCLGIYLLMDFYSHTTSSIRKEQAIILIFTSIITLLSGTLTNIVLQKLNIHNIPPAANILFLVWASGIAYAIIKYKFLAITPVTAAVNIIRTMSDCLILLNPQGAILSVNPATVSLFGYTEKELVGQSIEIMIADKISQKQILSEITGLNEFRNRGYIFKDKKGKPITLTFSKTLMKDELGQINGIVCIAKDITAFERTEAALRQSEIRYRTIVENIRELIIITQPDGLITFLSPECQTITGYSEDELLGTRFSQIHPEDFDLFDNAFKRSIAGKCEAYVEHRAITKSGELRWFAHYWRPLLHEGELYLIVHDIRDITLRKKAQEDLALAKEHAELLFRLVPNAIFTVDKQQRITSWNKKAAEITGYREDEVMGQDCRLLAVSPCAENCELLCADIQKPIFGRECFLKTKSGAIITISKNVDILKDGHGNIIGGIESFEDITLRIQSEKNLEIAKHEAETANQTKSRFVANMSHEIRTPMNAIIGFSDLLRETPLNDTQRDYLDTISASGEALLALINDILDISKIEAGEVHLEHIDFDLEYLVESVIRMIRPKLYGRALELFYEFEPAMPRYYKGDPTKLRQILLNLLGNAIKFTDCGEIKIIVNRGPHDAALTEFQSTGRRMIRITVKDTGIGIPKEKQATIFEAFTQSDESITRRYGGTGLGLTISRHLAQLMDGDLTVESEENRGSEFTVTAKLREAAPESLHPDISPLELDHLKNIKTITVDDHKSSRHILDTYVQEFGMTIFLSTASAQEVLDWLSSHKTLPDIIFSDVLMPEIDGYELAKIIRSQDKFRNIKLVAITSDARPGSAKTCQDAGFDAYLPKPMIKGELLRVIQSTLGDKRTAGPIITKHLSAELVRETIKVLVVEDNPSNQKLMRVLLTNLGCEVELAGNGMEAIDVLRKKKFDLCLMDLQMPVLGGLEATKIIRAEISKKLPIIALTADVQKESADKCAAFGMTDYALKPINAIKLKELISKYAKISR
ncbi:MAG: PAS domain S-box protein [Candidatus Omnitrophica bacterium]|nr:PAS domain S-box protein [Candidatus Omnitrophota bacterium]MDD5671077.1 PAS domain S-box protein [Candidatus Omnitrophota bacterium]